MKTSRLPIAIQQAVMRRLREKLAQANLKLGRNYPEPKLSYTQRGTSAGTAGHWGHPFREHEVSGHGKMVAGPVSRMFAGTGGGAVPFYR